MRKLTFHATVHSSEERDEAQSGTAKRQERGTSWLVVERVSAGGGLRVRCLVSRGMRDVSPSCFWD